MRISLNLQEGDYIKFFEKIVGKSNGIERMVDRLPNIEDARRKV